MARAGVPEAAQAPHTNPEIALGEIDRVRAAGVRFGLVLADAGYGCSAACRAGLSARGLSWAVGPRGAVDDLTGAVQAAAESFVEKAFVDQGYTGERAVSAAARHGIEPDIVWLPEAKRGFVLLSRRWAVERSFAWASRFRRHVEDDERLPSMVEGLHLVAFACLMLRAADRLIAGS